MSHARGNLETDVGRNLNMYYSLSTLPCIGMSLIVAASLSPCESVSLYGATTTDLYTLSAQSNDTNTVPRLIKESRSRPRSVLVEVDTELEDISSAYRKSSSSIMDCLGIQVAGVARTGFYGQSQLSAQPLKLTGDIQRSSQRLSAQPVMDSRRKTRSQRSAGIGHRRACGFDLRYRLAFHHRKRS